MAFYKAFELPHNKTDKMACASSEDSDQSGHPPSPISLRCNERTAKTDRTGRMGMTLGS